MNAVTLIGRLTKDPAITYTAEQMAVCRLNVAIDRGKNKNGEDMGADFPSVVCFGKLAENCERFLKKGRLVGVAGKITTGKYEDKEGRTVYTTDVTANRIEFLEWDEDKSEKPAKKEDGFTMITDDDIPF